MNTFLGIVALISFLVLMTSLPTAFNPYEYQWQRDGAAAWSVIALIVFLLSTWFIS
jgi:hypothetical protein